MRMNVKYSIFGQDKDKWMFKIDEESKLNYHLEKIDVENCEYAGWDVEGKPIEFYVDDEKIKIRYKSSQLQIEKLKEAILDYAKLGNPREEFIDKYSDVKELFQAVERHIDKARMSNKMKKKSTEFIEKFKKLFKH